jgi:hypothetical protein
VVFWLGTLIDHGCALCDRDISIDVISVAGEDFHAHREAVSFSRVVNHADGLPAFDQLTRGPLA